MAALDELENETLAAVTSIQHALRKCARLIVRDASPAMEQAIEYLITAGEVYRFDDPEVGETIYPTRQRNYITKKENQ